MSGRPSRRWPDGEQALLFAIRAGIALLLLTPLVSFPGTYFPFAVGKALYARSIIAVVVALWVLLALSTPRWRPAPGAILAILAAGLAVAFLTAWLGVGPERSLWSTYTRMEGLVTSAHWCALVVVLAAVARTGADWVRLVKINVCVGLCVAAVAAVRFHAPDALTFPLGPETRYPRISGTTGNPTFLGVYLQVVVLLAVGLLVRSFFAAPAQDGAVTQAATRRRPGRVGAGRRRGRGSKPDRGKGRSVRAALSATLSAAPSADFARAGRPVPREHGWSERVFWAFAAAGAFHALTLTGSMGAMAGLGAGAGVAAAAYAWLGRSRRSRRTGLAALGLLALAGVVLALVLALRASGSGDREIPKAFDSVLLERATSADRIGSTLGLRLRNWEAGGRAFTERPLFGWGPGNYFAASARYLPRPDGPAKSHYHAHNMLIEEIVTKGLGGLAAYLALWGVTAAVFLRAVRRTDTRDRALIVFAGAALAGWFVGSQTLFYNASIWLQHMLLLGFAVHLEGRMCAGPRAPPWARLPTRLAFMRLPAVRVGAAAGALLLAGASLAANHAIFQGARAIYRAEHSPAFLAEMERSIRAFEPLATGPRIILFNNVAANWPVLVAHHRDEAARLLAWTDDEAPAALAAAPESWVLHHALTRLYRAVAATHPEYSDRARHHFGRSLALAPNYDPLEMPQSGKRGRR